MLRDYLPAERHGVTSHLDLPAAVNIAEILDRLGIPPAWRQLVVLNDEEIPRSAWATTRLKDGDRLAVFPPVAGGDGALARAGPTG